MGIGCALLLWSLFGAVAGIAAIGGVVVSRRSTGLLKVAGRLAAILGFVVALASGVFVAGWIVSMLKGPQYSTSPDQFEAEFRLAPGPDVQEVQSQSWGSTDSQDHLLRFRCAPETMAIIAKRFQRAPISECERQLQSGSKEPDWWQPRIDPATVCYEAVPFDTAFATNRAWLSYHPASRQAYFRYEGID